MFNTQKVSYQYNRIDGHLNATFEKNFSCIPYKQMIFLGVSQKLFLQKALVKMLCCIFQSLRTALIAMMLMCLHLWTYAAAINY